MKTLVIVLFSLACGAGAMDVLNLQELLDAAVKDGTKTLVLPPGRQRIEGRLNLAKATGLTIEGRGTTLVFSDYRGTGWSFHSCRDLVLRGFAIDYDPLPFVQGRITGRSEDGKVYEFTVSEGYPGLREEDRDLYRQGYVFEPDRQRWKPWVPDLYARTVEIVNERQGRFVMGYVPQMHELIEVGDRLVLTLRTGGAMRMNDCENVRLEDVTFLAAPGAAYLGRYMRGDNYYRYDIKPGEPPSGASEPRLISTCADGLNIAFATKGPVMENCHFSFMGDDSVNLHGVTLAVVGGDGVTELLAVWPYSPEYLATVIPAGSVVRRLQAGNYAVLGTGTIAEFAPVPGELAPEHAEAIRQVWPRNTPGRGTVFRLTLREPLPAQPGDFLDFPANNAPGFIIRNCEFTDHRARGLRIMASDGVIENNVFRRLKHSAITIGAEYGFWREAGWVENIVVRGNVIEDVGRDAAMLDRGAYSVGAINVFVNRDRNTPLPLWPGNRNLVIENNTIRDCPGPGIGIRAAQGVRIVGNQLEHVLYRPGNQSSSGAIAIEGAEHVEIGENPIRHPGTEPEQRD